MKRSRRSESNEKRGYSSKRSYGAKRMDTRTITRAISNEELAAAMSMYFSSMSILGKDEELTEVDLSNGHITLTIKRMT
jgi:hypothetical protein